MNRQSQNPGGVGSQSPQQKIDTSVTLADTISQPVLAYLRGHGGYSSIRPKAQIGMFFTALIVAWVLGAFMPHQSFWPVVVFIGTGAVMALKQRRRCWKDLKAGLLRNPYSRGESRLQRLLRHFHNRTGMPYFTESFVQRWLDPIVLLACGYLMLHWGLNRALGLYLLGAGCCLRMVESYVYTRQKEMYLNGIAALDNAQSQSSVAQHFQHRPAPELRNEAPAAGLSTGIGSDLIAKVAELKAQREGHNNSHPGGFAAAVVLLALLLPGMGRAGSVPAACACAGRGVRVEKAVLLRTPLAEGTYVTSSAFGLRMHPILKVVLWHGGIDLAAPFGTPILAAADGVVEAAGRYGCQGNYVRLWHGGGAMTSYSHASRIAPGIVRGALVRRGQVIAFVGSTGCSTGPHLHYQVWVNGRRVNPALVCHLLAFSPGCYFFPQPGPRRKTPVIRRA
jgi:murein DD-endopeptidase MepM/ murein hydrolase activator NlpD